MVLQITKTVGIYEINGDLNSQNVFSLNNYFDCIYKKINKQFKTEKLSAILQRSTL
jgi:hypothetical protein